MEVLKQQTKSGCGTKKKDKVLKIKTQMKIKIKIKELTSHKRSTFCDP